VRPRRPALVVRDPGQLADVLAGVGVIDASIAVEVAGSRPAWVTTTASRSVVGSMNEFAFLADQHRRDVAKPDLLRLSALLARAPCGPLLTQHVSLERETIAQLATDHTRTNAS
jgi:hypothetical protein